jgi:hypothetical protein
MANKRRVSPFVVCHFLFLFSHAPLSPSTLVFSVLARHFGCFVSLLYWTVLHLNL